MLQTEIDLKIESLYSEWSELLVLARSKINTFAWGASSSTAHAVYTHETFLIPYEPDIERIKTEIDYYLSLKPVYKLGF